MDLKLLIFGALFLFLISEISSLPGILKENGPIQFDGVDEDIQGLRNQVMPGRDKTNTGVDADRSILNQITGVAHYVKEKASDGFRSVYGWLSKN